MKKLLALATIMTAVLATGCSTTNGKTDTNSTIYSAELGKYTVDHSYNRAYDEDSCNLIIRDQGFAIWLKDIEGNHTERKIYVEGREAYDVGIFTKAFQLPRQSQPEDDRNIQVLRDSAKIQVVVEQDGQRKSVDIDTSHSREAIRQFEKCRLTHIEHIDAPQHFNAGRY